MYFYDLEPAIFGGLSRENRDERDLCSCRTITASSLSNDDSTYLADCCTTETHKVNILHAQYTTQIECGIVVTCHYHCSAVQTERCQGTCRLFIWPSNTVLIDVDICHP